MNDDLVTLLSRRHGCVATSADLFRHLDHRQSRILVKRANANSGLRVTFRYCFDRYLLCSSHSGGFQAKNNGERGEPSWIAIQVNYHTTEDVSFG